MPPIWELIADREAAATATAQRLREQIGTLTEQLQAAENELAELTITRQTLTRLTGGPEPTPPADPSRAHPDYQQIIAVFSTATGPIRARDICLALGLAVPVGCSHADDGATGDLGDREVSESVVVRPLALTAARPEADGVLGRSVPVRPG